MTKITLENECGEYAVSSHEENMNMEELLHTLVIPLLRAAGYAESTICNYIKTQ